jgi:tetratricopeptide (TPR) repeat protein
MTTEAERANEANEVNALVKEGQAALLAGDSYTARQRFRQALDLAPDNVEALLGMAGTVLPYREKRDFLQRALDLDADNADARASLHFVEQKIAAGEVLAPRGVVVREPLPGIQAVPEPEPEPEPQAENETLFCYIHPDRETGLRCIQCQRPICGQCMVRAAVGQLCPECAHARRPRNYQVSASHIVIASVLGLVVGATLSFLVFTLVLPIPFLSFIIAFILAPIVGEFLVRVLDRLTHAKRGREMQLATGISLGLASAPLPLFLFIFGGIIAGLVLTLFAALMIGTAVTRLR